MVCVLELSQLIAISKKNGVTAEVGAEASSQPEEQKQVSGGR